MILIMDERFGIFELQNRVMKPSYAKWRRVTNSKIFIEILLSSY